ncbi:UDP-N-acetylmuramoylalanine--D-glutamate ligase [Anaerolineae bacterium]|nr:UDP-N-acetylmuramoylalanine--D-glutamate ligase [Anaerolineae bacterium]
MNLNNKRVLVFGLGVHGGGLGVAQWLVSQGAIVAVTDLRTAEQLQSSLDALRGLPIKYVLGEHRDEDFVNADLIVRNPGVPRESRFLQIAQEHSIPVEMEMGLFVERLPRGMAQVIGITGTKGKTTTTLMVGEILKRANPKTVVAGNLRVSALELLDQIDDDTPVVLELSSWQLEAFPQHKISPHIAAITNISADHLNRYHDLDDYAEAKATIFRYQQPGDFLVLNFDNKLLTRFAPQSFGKVVWTSATRALKDGACREGEWLVWKWNGATHKILRVSDLRVPGLHNVANALTAIALAAIWSATPDQIADSLAEFRGVPHRQELVRELNGVRYINDTTATAPAAAIVAIETFAPNIILITGGADKSLDFTEMARVIASKVKRVILLEGTATEKIARALHDAGADDRIAGRFDDLQHAVERAKEIAQSGDVVLLSPGCASFGMFANEFERGEKFKELVNSLQSPVVSK